MSNAQSSNNKYESLTANSLLLRGSLFLIAATIIFTLSRTVADPDLWGHIQFGKDTIENISLSRFDTYSYTSDQPWINHEWFAEVIMAAAWLTTKSFGLVFLKLIIGLLTICLSYRSLLRKNISSLWAGIIVLGILPALTIPFATVRPHIFTILAFELVLLIILQAEQGHYSRLWFSIPLFALWVNLHGGFIAGLGILCLWAVIHLIHQPSIWKKVIPPVLLSFFATLLNPYGVNLWIFLIKTATIPRPEIGDWQPLKILSPFGIFYIIWLTLAILVIVYSNKPRNMPNLVLLGVIATLPLIAIRHIPLFALSIPVLLGDEISDVLKQLLKSKTQKVAQSTWLGLIPFGLGFILFIVSIPSLIRIPLWNYPKYPVYAVQLLNDSNIQGNLATEFNWGEYIIWYLSPQIKVSIDGRRETVYSKDIYQKVLDFLHGTNKWSALIEGNTDLVLVYKNSPIDNLMANYKGWSRVYEDIASVLYVRESFSQAQLLIIYANNFSPFKDDGYFP